MSGQYMGKRTWASGVEDVFTIKARRCKRCGGLLTSSQAIQDGYGPCCLRKIRQEAKAKEELKNQYSLFDEKGRGDTDGNDSLRGLSGAAADTGTG